MYRISKAIDYWCAVEIDEDLQEEQDIEDIISLATGGTPVLIADSIEDAKDCLGTDKIEVI